MVKKIEVNVPNRIFYFISVIFILVLLGIGVYAFGGTSPSVMGHTMGELQGSCTGLLKWTGSAWDCIPVPPVCTETDSFLHFDGSAWSCYTPIIGTECDWDGWPLRPDDFYYVLAHELCDDGTAPVHVVEYYCNSGYITSTRIAYRCGAIPV